MANTPLSARLLLVLTLIAASAAIFQSKPAVAANFGNAYIRLDRIKTGVTGNVVVVLQPTTTATEGKVVLTMTGFTIAATPTLSTSNLPAGTTALPGTLVAAGSGSTITITGVTDLTVGTNYAFNIVTGVTNATAGAYTATVATQTGASAAIDSTDVALRIVADDQIVVNATVPPSLTVSLSGNTASFTGQLDPAAIVSTTGITLTVGTNGTRGWTGSVKSLNAGLTSATTGQTITAAGTIDAAPSTLTAGTVGNVLDVDLTTDSGLGAGTLSIAAEYNGASTSAGGTPSTSLQTFASGNGTTGGDIVTLIERAAISSVTAAAADYTDTLTVIVAGNF